jgi:hypothetical protein
MALITGGRGFESRQGISFIDLYTLQYCSLQLNINIVCTYLGEINAKYKIYT